MTSQVSSPAEQAEPTERASGDAPPPTAQEPALLTVPHHSPNGADGVGGKEVRRLERVIIRFAGDSGDGMQLTGDRFTSET
ncbi:2-oxoglutarate ferredoxin oxidoreductase subunit alpha, partial [Streptomyces sp. NPDC046215]